jgi:hypothetical protein
MLSKPLAFAISSRTARSLAFSRSSWRAKSAVTMPGHPPPLILNSSVSVIGVSVFIFDGIFGVFSLQK